MGLASFPREVSLRESCKGKLGAVEDGEPMPGTLREEVFVPLGLSFLIGLINKQETSLTHI